MGGQGDSWTVSSTGAYDCAQDSSCLKASAIVPARGSSEVRRASGVAHVTGGIKTDSASGNYIHCRDILECELMAATAHHVQQTSNVWESGKHVLPDDIASVAETAQWIRCLTDTICGSPSSDEQRSLPLAFSSSSRAGGTRVSLELAANAVQAGPQIKKTLQWLRALTFPKIRIRLASLLSVRLLESNRSGYYWASPYGHPLGPKHFSPMTAWPLAIHWTTLQGVSKI